MSWTTKAATAAGAIAVLSAVSLAATEARAAFTATLSQVGVNVVMTGSGTIDLTDLTPAGSGSAGAGVFPGLGLVGVGSTTDESTLVYTGITGAVTFGPGGATLADSGSGDKVAIVGYLPALEVQSTYVSGAPLSDSSTFDGATLSSLGATPGIYTLTWGIGRDADSFTLIIGNVPEPASMALIVTALAGLGLARRRRSGKRAD